MPPVYNANLSHYVCLLETGVRNREASRFSAHTLLSKQFQAPKTRSSEPWTVDCGLVHNFFLRLCVCMYVCMCVYMCICGVGGAGSNGGVPVTPLLKGI